MFIEDLDNSWILLERKSVQIEISRTKSKDKMKKLDVNKKLKVYVLFSKRNGKEW
jgi:hypothetical protein